MGRDTTEFDPNMEGQPHEESANADLEAAAVASFNSLESFGLVPNAFYQDDPSFQELLLHFQKAEWGECLEKINNFLVTYPEDNYLLAFKQEVEVRLKLQKASQQQQAKENFKRFRKYSFRFILIIILAVSASLLIVQTGNSYQAAKLAQEATLAAESLAAKYLSAENYLSAGRFEDALRLYTEIQQTNPSYKDVDRRIQLVKQSLAVIDLYNQGVQALADGQSDKALEILLQVEELRPGYKDTHQLIQKIEQEKKVASLVKEIQDAYSREDWEGVVRNYEAIQAMDSFIELPELKNILFVSYRKLILDTAGHSDLTLEEIETTEKYYRRAIALFPQNKGYAAERAELQKIAVELLANKYYLHAVGVLDSSNYSIQGLQEAILVLTKASNIGSNSPVITAEMEKAQLFLSAYNDILNRRWDESISGFEKLFRKEENYAGGRVKYFLYEAYTARGDLLLANADFADAFVDYQAAEKFAWGDVGNLSRLFQIEVRIATVLRRLGRDKDAADYYHNIFERLKYKNRLTSPEDQDLLNALVQADLAYKQVNLVDVFRLYDIALKQKEKLYDQTTVAVNQGDTLANVAFESGTTIESLRTANNLGESMIINKKQEFLVPFISADGQ